LRDEFFMADEAFALSPISARATMPGEADYDAISAAFMETSRGRWFLSEYAKRNRNADTSMVLDAVARIEANIAAQKDAAPEHALAEALAAIREAVDEARAAAALGGAAVDESLAPIRKGAHVIHETLLRLREIGADGRIYDLMDSQVSAIEAGCRQIASTDAKAALRAAFDRIDQRIKEFEGDDDAPSPVRETPPSPSATVDEQAPAAMAEFVPPSESAPEAAAASSSDDVAATAQIEPAAPEVDIAHDEAVLDLIALEMAAPDFDEPDIAEADVMATNSVEPDLVSQAAEPPQPEPAPIPQPSLGASLIANGIVRRPDTSYADPLAPIRRMSQAEKIAFFS
jgi:chemotaxis protein histidine kinase CheA